MEAEEDHFQTNLCGTRAGPRDKSKHCPGVSYARLDPSRKR
jgi:hypothetical protein